MEKHDRQHGKRQFLKVRSECICQMPTKYWCQKPTNKSLEKWQLNILKYWCKDDKYNIFQKSTSICTTKISWPVSFILEIHNFFSIYISISYTYHIGRLKKKNTYHYVKKEEKEGRRQQHWPESTPFKKPFLETCPTTILTFHWAFLIFKGLQKV